ncbi:rod-binding protein [Pseudoponticoccus marisrubri]|uniref:rod-binding protein n=1 Tax=Pseudoponticoccus marisrubri TaxID=1685382 RepID=UPI000A047FC5|nr:rod-binding protein [Pseudoponticoccus marisrubri]
MIVSHPVPHLIQNAHARLHEKSEQLEAVFLAEMLKSAGVGKTPDAFGGGIGEDHFASFLRQEQAQNLAARGGIGLAEALFDSLKGHDHD